MKDLDRQDIIEVLQDELEGIMDDVSYTYESTDSPEGEELEYKARSGFMPYTDGGYKYTFMSFAQNLEGSGIDLPTKVLQDRVEESSKNADEYAQSEIWTDNKDEEFRDKFPTKEDVNYSDLEDFDSEYSESFDETVRSYRDDESIIFSIEAMYYKPENDKGEDGKNTITLSGSVNLEAPYHRRGFYEDFKEITFTFSSIDSLEKKLRNELEVIKSWFDGSDYKTSTTELKQGRLENGGKVYGSSYQDEVEDRVRDLTEQEYEVFAFDNRIDPEDANEMSDFISDLEQDEATQIINQLKGESYAKGGKISDNQQKKIEKSLEKILDTDVYSDTNDIDASEFYIEDGEFVIGVGVGGPTQYKIDPNYSFDIYNGYGTIYSGKADTFNELLKKISEAAKKNKKSLLEKQVYAKGGKIDKDIAKFKKQLISKEKSRGLYENFGQKEVSKINDKYDAYERDDMGVQNATKIQEFSDWASGYDGTRYAKGGKTEMKYYQPEYTDRFRDDNHPEFYDLSENEVFKSKKLAEQVFPKDKIIEYSGDDIKNREFIDKEVVDYSKRTSKDFKLGELVYDTDNKRYGTIIGIYDDSPYEVRLDSDGMQPTDWLRKLGEQGDKGTKKQLFEGVSAIERLRKEYPENNYPKLINNPFYAKGGSVAPNTRRANQSPLLRFANFKDGSHINLIQLTPYKRGGRPYQSEYKFAVSISTKDKGQQVLNYRTLKEAERDFEELVGTRGAKTPLIDMQWDGYVNQPFAKGGKVEKKGNEMLMGGLAGVLLGIFLNK